MVHAIAGFAALASVFYVGKRRDKQSPPNSIPLIAIGTGLLWFGWYGFNAGSELAVNAMTGLAFLNTDVAASFAAIVWLVIEWTVQEGQNSWAHDRCSRGSGDHHSGGGLCFVTFREPSSGSRRAWFAIWRSI